MKKYLILFFAFFFFTTGLESEKSDTDVPETTTQGNPKDVLNHQTQLPSLSSSSSSTSPPNNQSESLFHEVEGVAKRVFDLTFNGLVGIVTRISHVILDDKPVNLTIIVNNTTTVTPSFPPTEKPEKDIDTLVHENDLTDADVLQTDEYTSTLSPKKQSGQIKH